MRATFCSYLFSGPEKYFSPITWKLSYTVYTFVSVMAKETASFKIRKELREAFKREADKENRTLSWYLETIAEDFAKRKKIKA